MIDAEAIATALGGRCHGTGYRSACPCCGGSDKATKFSVKDVHWGNCMTDINELGGSPLDRSMDNPVNPKTRPFIVTQCMKDVQPEPVRWMWKSRIALGKVTLIRIPYCASASDNSK